MTSLEDLNAARTQIEAFMASDPKLEGYKSFLFNVRGPTVKKVSFIVMGMNPGESRGTRSSTYWVDTCAWMLGTDQFAETEMIFWNSHNPRVLVERLGDLTPYFTFCGSMNLLMIDYHQPKAIVLPGLAWMLEAVEHYGLTHVNSVPNAKGQRLIEHWERDGRPWVFSKHWSGAFGFSKLERAAIRDYIAAVCPKSKGGTQ